MIVAITELGNSSEFTQQLYTGHCEVGISTYYRVGVIENASSLLFVLVGKYLVILLGQVLEFLFPCDHCLVEGIQSDPSGCLNLFCFSAGMLLGFELGRGGWDWEWSQNCIFWRDCPEFAPVAFTTWLGIDEFTNFCLKNQYKIDLDG